MNCHEHVQNSKYKPLCAQCYYDKNPDADKVRNIKVKERAVVDFIKAEFSTYIIQYDSCIHSGQSRRRPDIMFTLADRILIIEVDENQHKSKEYVEDDEERLVDIVNDTGDTPVILIRFNPDSYTSDSKRVSSCFAVNKETKHLEVKRSKQWSERL